MHPSHDYYMRLALQLAAKGRYTVSPNPMVGCVLVNHDEIVGTGFHVYAGGPHAEVVALAAAGHNAVGATAYLTLEPCCHYGRTPPCTDALIAAGIAKVFMATLDPNPLVAGQGMAALRAAGIAVEAGLLQTEAEKLNRIFFHYMQHGTPFVIAKWAMSLDGKMITHENDSRAITSTPTMADVHATRQQVDAILIGANTALHDNPQLTVRHVPAEAAFVKHPLRVILSSHTHLPLDLKLFDPQLPGKTLLVTTEKTNKKDIEIVTLPANHKQQVDLPALLIYLGKQNITSLLVEGGHTILASFFEENLVNEVTAYIAPVIISHLSQKKKIYLQDVMPIGADYCFKGYVEEK